MRTIIAKLDVDEDRLLDIGYEETIVGVEKEFSWLTQSGINLSDAFVADDDETDKWCVYINYVANWCFDSKDEGSSPISYKDWMATNIHTYY